MPSAGDMHAQVYMGLVLKNFGVPNPHSIADSYFHTEGRIKSLQTLSVTACLEKYTKPVLITREELKLADLWSKTHFEGIDNLPESLLFRLFRVVQMLGRRVVCVFYGMHTMFTICPRFQQGRNTLVAHKDYVPTFWNNLIERTKFGKLRQPMMVTISGNAVQRLTISTPRLRFLANHPEWLITISNSEISLDSVDGHILFARNITFDTCFFKTHQIFMQFQRIGNCRFCDVISSSEHVQWLEGRDEDCEI